MNIVWKSLIVLCSAIISSCVLSAPQQGYGVLNFLTSLASGGGATDIIKQVPGMNILQQYLPSGVQQYLPSGAQQYFPSGAQQYLPSGIQQYLANGLQQYLPSALQQYLVPNTQHPQYPTYGNGQNQNGYGIQYPTYGTVQNQNGYGQYAPGHGGYYPVDAGLVGALTSIAKYDDLKCVPRLLCEMAAGGRPGNTGKQDNSNVLPFLSRDTLLTLLTIFNFGDTSPLLVFGRAVLLGVTSLGASHTCYSAYPTCPRNPDQLVYYLNNHRGGFFQYFNNLQRPAVHYNYQSRILNHAHHQSSSESYSYDHKPYKVGKKLKYSDESNYVKNDVKNPFVFPFRGKEYGTHDSFKSSGFPSGTSSKKINFAFPTKDNIKTQYLLNDKDIRTQSLQSSNQPMIFPDRTGTGDLRLDTDQAGNIVISSASANKQRGYQDAHHSVKKQMFFPLREQRHADSVRFPSPQDYPSS